jgi:hypothetical protein
MCRTSAPRLRARRPHRAAAGDARPERHPACRQREAQPGSCTERENLTGDAKGKGASGSNARPKVPMRRRGADCSVVVMKRV